MIDAKDVPKCAAHDAVCEETHNTPEQGGMHWVRQRQARRDSRSTRRHVRPTEVHVDCSIHKGLDRVVRIPVYWYDIRHLIPYDIHDLDVRGVNCVRPTGGSERGGFELDLP